MGLIDYVIIGGGVIGLAVSVDLSSINRGKTIVLLERHNKFGQETSSRNSEVIHSGIYYPTNSLKASLCVEGNKLLYEFCDKWNVPYERIGKLIIARTEEEIRAINSLMQKGLENGVLGLEFVTKARLNELEPNIKAEAGVLSQRTGIIDSHKLMNRLESMAVEQNVMLAYGHNVVAISKLPKEGFKVIFNNPEGEKEEIECKWIINCAGLSSDVVASMVGINIIESRYKIYPCKGEYFSVSCNKSQLVSHLIYPSPLKELEGLGVHATKTLDGRLRLGPNTIYTNEINYEVSADHQIQFYDAAKQYLPFIDYKDLEPDMSGIRPKLQGSGMPFRDFIISHEIEKGLKGFINLIGIESPGLTSCLSIAKLVNNLINKSEEEII
jgi:L-2-hydroxyglutarate oxidase LhgO